MMARHLVFAVALAGLAVQLSAVPRARAQSTTTGAIQGQVADADTGDNLVGVTVVVSSPVLQGTQTAISDENGSYKIAGLPPGTYLVSFYINQLTVRRPDINVGVNKTTPVFQKLKLGAGEDGSGLLLLDEATEPGVHIIARRIGTGARPLTTSLTLRGTDGQERVIRP